MSTHFCLYAFVPEDSCPPNTLVIFFLQITLFKDLLECPLFAQSVLKLLYFPFESDGLHCSSDVLPWKEQPVCPVTPILMYG